MKSDTYTTMSSASEPVTTSSPSCIAGLCSTSFSDFFTNYKVWILSTLILIIGGYFVYEYFIKDTPTESMCSATDGSCSPTSQPTPTSSDHPTPESPTQQSPPQMIHDTSIAIPDGFTVIPYTLSDMQEEPSGQHEGLYIFKRKDERDYGMMIVREDGHYVFVQKN